MNKTYVNITNENIGNISTGTYLDSYNVISPELFLLLYKIFYFGIIPSTILLGLFGNMLTFNVFCSINQWTTPSISLFCLTLADTLALCCNAVIVVSQILRIFVPKIGLAVYAVLAPVFYSMLFSVFGRIASVLPVLISLERLIAVTWPLHAKRILTKRVAFVTISSAALFVTILFTPNAFLLETYVAYDNVTGTMQYTIRETKFGKDLHFWNPFINAQVVLFRIIPAFFNGIFNIIIVIILFRNIRKRKTMTRIDGYYPTIEESRDLHATKTVVAITFVYVLCSLPRAINRMLTIAEAGQISELYAFSTNAQRLFTVVTFELDNINSSINFIIYIATSRIYRKKYKQIFSCVKTTKHQNTIISRGSETLDMESFKSVPL